MSIAIPRSLFRRRRLAARWLGAAVLLASWGGEARAQYAGSIPFNPWGGAYQSYVYPVAPTNGAVPNAARVRSGEFGFASNLDSGMSPLDVGLGASGLGGPAMSGPTGPLDARFFASTGGRYIPYTAAYRRFDAPLGRLYNPNAEADNKYYGGREQLETLYNKYMAERDPQKREALRKDLEQIRNEIQKDRGYSTRRDGPVAPGSRAAAPGGRRPAGTPPPGATTTSQLAVRPLDLMPPLPGGLTGGTGGGPLESLAAFGPNRDYAALERKFPMRRPDRDDPASPRSSSSSASEIIERTLRPSNDGVRAPLNPNSLGGLGGGLVGSPGMIDDEEAKDLEFNDGVPDQPPAAGALIGSGRTATGATLPGMSLRTPNGPGGLPGATANPNAALGVGGPGRPAGNLPTAGRNPYSSLGIRNTGVGSRGIVGGRPAGTVPGAPVGPGGLPGGGGAGIGPSRPR